MNNKNYSLYGDGMRKIQCLFFSAIFFSTKTSALTLNYLKIIPFLLGYSHSLLKIEQKDLCQIDTDKAISGTYQVIAMLPDSETMLENEESHTTNLIYTDENCYVEVNDQTVNYSKIAPGDELINCKLDSNLEADLNECEKVEIMDEINHSPIHWKRAVIITNSAMDVATADAVMTNSKNFFDTMSRGQLTMSHDIYELDGQVGCSIYDIYREFNQIALNNGIDIFDYDKVTYIVDIKCGWGGVAYVNGRYSVIQAYDLHDATAVEFHETGHLLGGFHANSNGKEYDDYNDPLGSGYNHVGFNAPHLLQFDYLNSNEYQEFTSLKNKKFLIENLDNKDSNKDTLQVIVFKKKPNNIYISYRKIDNDLYSFELDKSDVVEIHEHDGGAIPTNLIGRIKKGEQFIQGGYNITFVEKNGAKAQIIVSEGSYKMNNAIYLSAIFALITNYYFL